MAAATCRHFAPRGEPQRIGEQHEPDRDEDHQPEEPQRLRDHRGGLQRRLAARAGAPGLRDHVPAVPRDEAEEADEEDQPQEVEREAQPRGKEDVERVDADVPAVDQRGTESPGGADRERVARELVRAADGRREELAHDDVDADQDRRREHQRPAEPQAEACQASNAVHQRVHPALPWAPTAAYSALNSSAR